MNTSIADISKYAIISTCGLYFTYKLYMKNKVNQEKRKQIQVEQNKMNVADMDNVGVPRRVLRKAETVLRRRTDRLSIVIERSTNSQNYTAVLRSAEALGVQNVYLISPPGWQQNNKRRKKNRFVDDDEEWIQHVAYARMAQKWLTIHVFKTSQECIENHHRHFSKDHHLLLHHP